MLSKKGASREEGIFIVVAGPSGVGKTTLCKALIQQIPGLKFSVSFTTRETGPNLVSWDSRV
jgi:guanylate kinase